MDAQNSNTDNPNYINRIPSKRVKFTNNTNTQKECPSGLRVKFDNVKDVPFSVFIPNYNNKGALQCGDKYPRYMYDSSKYCCGDTPFTNQELLDYINFLLNLAMNNINNTVFEKYLRSINYLKRTREVLLNNNPGLNNELTSEILETWILESLNGSRTSIRDRNNRTPFKKPQLKKPQIKKTGGGTNKIIRSRTKNNIKKNKKSKSRKNKMN